MAGRPTEYKEEYNEQVYKLCLLGAIDKDIADFFDIQESTLNLWKKKHPEFMEAIKDGKEKADAEVAKSLYKRAIGYKKKSIQFATFKGEITDREEYFEDVPPDTTAAIKHSPLHIQHHDLMAADLHSAKKARMKLKDKQALVEELKHLSGDNKLVLY